MANQEVEMFLERAKKWKEEMKLLRKICLACGMKEEFKWMHPCYTLEGKNIVLIHGFKEYCALLFHKGVLLKDQDNILIQQTENVQSARQIRFTNLQEIVNLEHTLKTYILEAIEVEKAGLEVKMKKTAEFDMPVEFEEILDNNPNLRASFNALTPGRQRAYLLYFSKAKQSKTRKSRIEKYIPKILEGQGLND
ncbi:MAG: YdeI family protein [Saprospiraceae bacterium]|nr:YdeI family protein [Saprospiraceae bacterium]